MTAPDWWHSPREVTVIVDNPSWILPYARQLVSEIVAAGDRATFVDKHEQVPQGAVAFYLGCIKICAPDVLARNKRNLLVHESDLPKGRGFSPLTWQVLEGKSAIPIVLVEAAEAVDAGSILYREQLAFEGHELIDEMRTRVGLMTIELCKRYLAEKSPISGLPQTGVPSFYRRRNPNDSKLDPAKTIIEQFNLLRVVDNDRYPAFFDLYGHRYKLSIVKQPSNGQGC